jgi:hypothetical protein
MARKKAKVMRMEKRRERVLDLLLAGETYRTIVDRLKKEGHKISLGTIYKDVKYIQDQWRESMASTYEQRVAAELGRLLEIDAEAAQEWELYKKGERQQIKRERVGGKRGDPPRMVTTEIKTILPDRGFLETRRAVSGDIRQLLGLNKPTKVEMNGNLGTSNPLVDKLADALGESDIRDLLAAIKSTMGKS